MPKPLTGGLMARLVFLFVACTIVAAACVGFLSFSRARAALNQAELDRLEAIRNQTAQSIVNYLAECVSDLRFLAQNWRVRAAFDTFSFYSAGDARGSAGSAVLNSKEYKVLAADLQQLFTDWLNQNGAQTGCQDLLIIVNSHRGHIVYTQQRLSDLDSYLKTGKLKDTPLAEMWERVTRTQKPAVADLGLYEPSGGLAAFLGVPVVNEKQVLGVLAMRIDSRRIDETIRSVAYKGETSDAYLVGEDGLMRSNSRASPSGVLRQKANTDWASAILAKSEGTRVTVDSRGVGILASWAPLGLNAREGFGAGFDWRVIATVASAEALRPVTALAYEVAVIALCIGIAAAALAFLTARAIANPVASIAKIAARVSDGDLSVDVPEVQRNDEVGQLTLSSRLMVRNLKEQTQQMLDGVGVLKLCVEDLSAIAQDIAGSTSRTTTAIAQTAATVEELKQSAKLSRGNASKVAQIAREAEQVSKRGSEATHDTIGKMNLIREQMESVNEKVVALSERGRDLEEIVNTYKDLADQSNLLAVNASIEAARAGDQGKGFAVVSLEIKALADQSKQATELVRAILGDTRKLVAEAVMATEQATKAVEAGLSQSQAASQSIRTLQGTAESSAQAAELILASSEDQMLGVDQVSSAMSNIEESINANLAGADRLKSSMVRLEQLAGTISSLLQRYRI